MLPKIIHLQEQLNRKLTKLVAIRYAENPFLDRDDLSESELVLLEHHENPNKNKNLLTIVEEDD